MGRAPATVVSRTAVSALGMAVQGAARFAYTWAVARFVGQVEVGQINTVLAVAIYAALFWPQGAGIAATRYLPTPSEAPGAITWLRRTVLVTSGVLALAGALVTYLLLADPLAALTCGFLVAAYSGYVFTRGVLIGRDHINRATLWDSVTSLFSLGVLVLVIVGRLSWALLLPLAGGYLIFTVANWPRGNAAEPGLELKGQVRKFTFDNSLAVLASGGLLPATMMMVQWADSPGTAGNFAVAMSLATPASMLSQALNQVLVPHFARLRGQPPEIARNSHRRIFLASGLGFALLFGAIIGAAPWILHFFFGERYSAGAPAMQVLLGIVFLMSLMCAPSSYLVALGHQQLYARIWVVGLVVGTAVLLLAGPPLGQWGALLGYGIGAGGASLAVIAYALLLAPAPTPQLSR